MKQFEVEPKPCLATITRRVRIEWILNELQLIKTEYCCFKPPRDIERVADNLESADHKVFLQEMSNDSDDPKNNRNSNILESERMSAYSDEPDEDED